MTKLWSTVVAEETMKIMDQNDGTNVNGQPLMSTLWGCDERMTTSSRLSVMSKNVSRKNSKRIQANDKTVVICGRRENYEDIGVERWDQSQWIALDEYFMGL